MSDKNKFELHLLETDLKGLVAHYQPLIQIVVSKFISKGFFRPDEKMDMVQMVNASLLEGRMEKIREHFNGSVYLSTYVSKVIYNLCLEKARSKSRKAPLLEIDRFSNLQEHSISSHDRLVLQDEKRRLAAILKGVFKQRTKRLICLKVFSRIVLNDADLGEYRSVVAKHELAMVRTTFYDPYDKIIDKDAYHILCLLFNKIDDKTTDADSLRKWISLFIDKMLRLLNGDPPRASYDKETLKILLQIYFSD